MSESMTIQNSYIPKKKSVIPYRLASVLSSSSSGTPFVHPMISLRIGMVDQEIKAELNFEVVAE